MQADGVTCTTFRSLVPKSYVRKSLQVHAKMLMSKSMVAWSCLKRLNPGMILALSAVPANSASSHAGGQRLC